MKPKKILIATDGSDLSMRAVDEACDYIDPKTSSVKVVSAYYPEVIVGIAAVATAYNDLEKALRRTANQTVNKAVKRIRSHFGDQEISLTTGRLRGPAGKVIIEEADRWHADLIVVGSHGYGILGRLLGSVSNEIVHNARCSVLVVRGE